MTNKNQLFAIHRVDYENYTQHTYFCGIRYGLSKLFTEQKEGVETFRYSTGEYIARMDWHDGTRKYIATPITGYDTGGEHTTEISCYIE